MLEDERRIAREDPDSAHRKSALLGSDRLGSEHRPARGFPHLRRLDLDVGDQGDDLLSISLWSEMSPAGQRLELEGVFGREVEAVEGLTPLARGVLARATEPVAGISG